jgi:hypothetical protein
MSALGHKQTCAPQHVMSALPPIATAKADMPHGDVCFTPESGHVQCTSSCLLWAKSGHRPCQLTRQKAPASKPGLFREHDEIGPDSGLIAQGIVRDD